MASLAGLFVAESANGVIPLRCPRRADVDAESWEGSPLLAFVTTIRHPLNASSYERVERLLNATLASVCRQTKACFCVVVVHNRKPSVSPDHRNVKFVEVAFPPPSPKRSARIGLGPGHLDKGYKAVIGARAAMEMGATHVMFVDADDYVNCNLAAFVDQHSSEAGWFSDRGFIHRQNSRRVAPVERDFDMKAGSTSILRADLLGIPSALSLGATQAQIDACLGPSTAGYLFGSHDKWRSHAESMGAPLKPLPFAASIWEIGTGENLSGIVNSNRKTVPFGDELEREFGLARPSAASHLTASLTRSAARVSRRLGR